MLIDWMLSGVLTHMQCNSFSIVGQFNTALFPLTFSNSLPTNRYHLQISSWLLFLGTETSVPFLIRHPFQIHMITVLGDNGSPCLVPIVVVNHSLTLSPNLVADTDRSLAYILQNLYQSFIHSIWHECCPSYFMFDRVECFNSGIQWSSFTEFFILLFFLLLLVLPSKFVALYFYFLWTLPSHRLCNPSSGP